VMDDELEERLVVSKDPVLCWFGGLGMWMRSEGWVVAHQLERLPLADASVLGEGSRSALSSSVLQMLLAGRALNSV
jgi:hypothetical protein